MRNCYHSHTASFFSSFSSATLQVEAGQKLTVTKNQDRDHFLDVPTHIPRGKTCIVTTEQSEILAYKGPANFHQQPKLIYAALTSKCKLRYRHTRDPKTQMCLLKFRAICWGHLH